MRSPAQAILWELWRKPRPIWLTLLCVTLGWGLVERTLDPPELASGIDPSARHAIGLLLGLFCLGGCIVASSFTENDRVFGFAGPARRHFELPISTTHLVALPMLSGSATILSIFAVWRFLILKSIQFTVPTLEACLALVAGLLTFQSLLWSFRVYPKTRAALLAGWFLSAIVVMERIVAAPQDCYSFRFPLLLTIILSWLFACWSVEAYRAGSPPPISLPTLRWPIPGEGPPSLSLFILELRRNILAPALGLFVFFAGGILLMLKELRYDPTGGFPLIFLGLLGLGTVVWSLLAGLHAARDPINGEIGPSPFSRTLPVGSSDLVLAKMKTIALICCLAVLPAVSFIVVWERFFFARYTVWDSMEITATGFVRAWICAVVVLVPFAAVNGLPFWIFFRVRRLTWAALLLLVGAVTLSWVILTLRRHYPMIDRHIPALLWLCAAIKAVAAALAFYRAKMADLISIRMILLIILCWAVLTMVDASLLYWWSEELPAHMKTILLPASFLACPLARWPLTALALSRRWGRP